MAQWLRALSALPEDPHSIPTCILQLSIVPNPGDLMPSLGFQGHQVHIQYTDIRAGKIPIYHTTSEREEEGGGATIPHN